MSERYVRFAEEGNSGCLTLFSLGAMSGSAMQNASSTSMGWGAILPCSISLFSDLGRLLALFLCFGCLAMALTSTGTSLIPRECTHVSHSITLTFDFALRRFRGFTVSKFRGMKNGMGYIFFTSL